MKNIILTSICFLFLIPSFGQSDVTTESRRATFGELKHEGPYLRSEIILQSNIIVSSSDGNQYEVVSYNIIITPLDGEAQLWSISGNGIGGKMQSSLYQILPKDKIIIEGIRAKVNGNENDVVALKPIMFTVAGARGRTGTKSDKTTAKKTSTATDVTDKSSSYLQATYGDINVADSTAGYTLEYILAQNKIAVTTLDQEVEYTVKSFRMIIAPKEGPAMLASSSSNKITESMTKMLAKAVSGDRILVEAIKATANYKGEEFKANLNPIILTIP